MRSIQQAVTRSTWPVAGTVALIVMVLQPRPAVESEAPPIPDVPSLEVPAQEEWFQISAQDSAPPPPTKCVLDGRPGSGAREKAARAWFRDLSRRDRQTVAEICSMDASEPCLGVMFPAARATAEERREYDQYVAQMLREGRRELKRLTAQLPEIERDCAANYCAAMRPHYCDTPLVVTFDAQPVAFGAASQSTFAFQPDQPVSTDWPTATTPWIAIDLDRDGAITSGAELFGDATRLPDGSTASNGFVALAALDANGDGVIDRFDPAFHSLLLWADRNADRTSTRDELRPLGEVVTAIPLANRLSPRCDLRGNCEGERGVLRWQDESGTPRTGAVVDVYLPRR